MSIFAFQHIALAIILQTLNTEEPLYVRFLSLTNVDVQFFFSVYSQNFFGNTHLSKLSQGMTYNTYVCP